MLLCSNCGSPASHALLPSQVCACEKEACVLSAYLNASIRKGTDEWGESRKARKVPVNTGDMDNLVLFSLETGVLFSPESAELIRGDYLHYRHSGAPSVLFFWDWLKSRGIGIREKDTVDHPE